MEHLCKNCESKMGVWGIPGTFPTTKVLLWIDQHLDPDNKMGWNASKVNEMYEWYIKGIESGIPPYKAPDELKIGSFVLEHSGYSRNLVFGFMQALQELGQSETINKRWWTGDGVNAGAVPSFPDVRDVIGDPLSKTITIIKWSAGIAVVGGVLYFTWPLIFKARQKASRRG